MKPKLMILALMLNGCDNQMKTVTVTCPFERYTISISSSIDGRTYKNIGVNEVKESLWKGKRCLNCGGIHNPTEVKKP